MTFANPAFRVARQSVVGQEAHWVKVFDPPNASPPTPELCVPTNPVPEVMVAAGLQIAPLVPLPHVVQRDLMSSTSMDTWDGRKRLIFYDIGDIDNPTAAAGTWPGPAVRVPRGVIFHCQTGGHGPPPHSIHWHGLEPTPINDGVGHCSMEIGSYTYQFQPNFIGTYFYHCHRNTVQHFEFGLYGMFIVMCPDTYFATLQNPAIPIGACRDSKFRTAANLSKFPQFPGFNSNLLTAPDPQGQFQTDPHAMTIPYDVEVLWVPDDRDSVWSDLAPNARVTFPQMGTQPGVNDNFRENPGTSGFFAFNQFNPDYWFVTGVPVPAPRGGTGTIPSNVVIPPALNSGVSGTQVSINAQVGQTILVRCLDAAYDCIDVTFPVDVTVIAWDGRALGVPPYGQYNEPYLVPAGSVMHMSVARRFDALIRATSPINSFAEVQFIDNEGQVQGTAGFERNVIFTARIPINIVPAQAGAVFTLSGRMATQAGVGQAGATIALSGDAARTTTTNASGHYQFADLPNGNYTLTPAAIALSVITPDSRTFAISGADVIQDFTVAPTTFAVSGQVTNQASGAALAGVTISLSGPSNQTIVTGATGTYSLAGLASGEYTLTPSLEGFTFNPSSMIVSVSGANVTGRNFTGTAGPGFSINGRITNDSGVGRANVTVDLTGAGTRTVVTDASGNYSLTGLSNGTYTVTPTVSGVLVPASRSVTISNASVTGQDFVASAITRTVSGTVADAQGAPLAGVTVSLSGPVNRTVVTDASGNYSVTGLPDGNYTVTLSKAGVVFSPATVAVPLSGSDGTGQNFTGTVSTSTFSLSGRVTSQAGAALSGISLALSGATTRTVVSDASGNYSFTGLSNGTFSVTPSGAGLTFSPAALTATINGADVVSQSFVGLQPGAVTTFSISGRVTDQAGAALSGVTVALAGDSTRTGTTDASGNYTISGLSNGHFDVTPSLGSFDFGPIFRHVAINGTDAAGVDFVGTRAGLGFRHRILLPYIPHGSSGV